MKKSGISAQVIVILLFSEILDAMAQYCFKRSALGLEPTSLASLADAWALVRSSFSGGYLGIGIALVAMVFVLWLAVLSKVDLSVAMPLTSCSYIFVAFASVLFLHERISPLRWAGILLIFGGVYIVTRSAEPPDKPKVSK
ncbi:MAG: EamA family transporter [Opitutaceae bacterium]